MTVFKFTGEPIEVAINLAELPVELLVEELRRRGGYLISKLGTTVETELNERVQADLEERYGENETEYVLVKMSQLQEWVSYV